MKLLITPLPPCFHWICAIVRESLSLRTLFYSFIGVIGESLVGIGLSHVLKTKDVRNAIVNSPPPPLVPFNLRFRIFSRRSSGFGTRYDLQDRMLIWYTIPCFVEAFFRTLYSIWRTGLYVFVIHDFRVFSRRSSGLRTRYDFQNCMFLSYTISVFFPKLLVTPLPLVSIQFVEESRVREIYRWDWPATCAKDERC
jgi:hypothetical protein